MGGALRLLALAVTLLVLVAIGTVFFALVEGWSWLDAYFFTVVTLSTVGYGNFVPVTVAGKIGTTVFIFVGLGIFAVAIQQFGLFAMQKRQEHTEWLIARLSHRVSGSHDAHHGHPHAHGHGQKTVQTSSPDPAKAPAAEDNPVATPDR